MGDGTRIAARDISEAILEITGEALLSGDFDAFAAVFHVPHYMATMAGPVYMETQDDMRRVFDQMRVYFNEAGITQLNRKVTEARYVSDDAIESTHVSEILNPDGRPRGDYPVFSVIEKIDGVWKVVRSEYVLEPETGQAMAISKGDVSARINKDEG